MIGFAAAKINLHLHVTGRRADGYHLLDSLVVFADVGDTVVAAPGEGLTLTIDGPFAAGLTAGPDNLVLRAARRLAEATGVRADAALRLTKRLPVASGIGGGSADAAAALRVLGQLWGVEVPSGLAAELGADVPVCLASRPALMRGVGEVLEAAPPLPALGLLLVNPGVAVSTQAVFARREPGCTPACTLPAAWASVAELADWLRGLRNDLEAPARALCPQIGQVLDAIEALPGCRLARMSGSGATCFGLFDATPGVIEREGWWSKEALLF